jgi:uncharacterized protein YbjQ (UPF0145 family)
MPRCTSCGKPAGFMMSMCQECIERSQEGGAVLQRARSMAAELTDHALREELAKGAEAYRPVAWTALEEEARRRGKRFLHQGVMITTTPTLPGYSIERVLGIVGSEWVGGVHMFQEIAASFRDTFGGRSQTLQDLLRSGRTECLVEMQEQAEALGGNAVVGLAMDFSEISGQGKSMLFLVATGTAVRAVPIPHDLI